MICKRPWGFWLLLHQWPLFSKAPRYKLKLLYFKKGGAISMQRHKNRTELWRWLWGQGNWSLGAELNDLRSRSSCGWGSFIFVNKMEWHTYQALITSTLVLETQRGICMESDIERI
jgi:mannose-6-phosphate isomerase-like protein (cupin superfamily)